MGTNHAQRIAMMLLLCLGCGPAADSTPSGRTSSVVDTPFAANLRLFVAESQKLKNLIEMGAPRIEQDAKEVVLRDALAGLTPTTPAEQAKFTDAKELLTHLHGYAVISRNVIGQPDPETMRDKRGDKWTEAAEKVRTLSKKSMADYAVAINRLLAELAS